GNFCSLRRVPLNFKSKFYLRNNIFHYFFNRLKQGCPDHSVINNQSRGFQASNVHIMSNFFFCKKQNSSIGNFVAIYKFEFFQTFFWTANQRKSPFFIYFVSKIPDFLFV